MRTETPDPQTKLREPARAKVETRPPESPTVIQSKLGPIVFGPGLDDFNQYDDPC